MKERHDLKHYQGVSIRLFTVCVMAKPTEI